MKMNYKGHKLGDMSPEVKDYQCPDSCYTDRQPGKTTEYVERQERMVESEASKIRSQEYKGRYD